MAASKSSGSKVMVAAIRSSAVDLDDDEHIDRNPPCLLVAAEIGVRAEDKAFTSGRNDLECRVSPDFGDARMFAIRHPDRGGSRAVHHAIVGRRRYLSARIYAIASQSRAAKHCQEARVGSACSVFQSRCRSAELARTWRARRRGPPRRIPRSGLPGRRRPSERGSPATRVEALLRRPIAVHG